MLDRNAQPQPDLLRRITMDAGRQRLLPDIETTVSRLLKQLLTECMAVKAARSADE